MNLALSIVAVIASTAMLAAPDRVSMRLAASSRFSRASVTVQPRPEHRALVVSGTVFRTDDDGSEVEVWNRTSGVELDGERSRLQHVIEWDGVPQGLLRVHADVIGVCGTADAYAFVPW